MRSIDATRIVISLATGKTAIAYMPNHRTTPVPRAIPATPAIIPWVVPAAIPSGIAIIPWIIPRIVPAPHAGAPIVWTIAIVAIEPRIVVAIPAAHSAGIAEILFLVDILLGEVSIIVDAVGRYPLAYMKLDDIVTK